MQQEINEKVEPFDTFFEFNDKINRYEKKVSYSKEKKSLKGTFQKIINAIVQNLLSKQEL